MRAAPAFQVSLHRFGVWRAGVFLLVALGVATIAGWLITRERPVGPMALIAAAGAVAALGALGASLARTRPVVLRWDGRAWHLGAAPGDPVPGDVHVAIDVGPWMLLRFVSEMPEGPSRTVWLPVQRRGLEAQWHALRCSVYSPRPAPADDAPVRF